MVDQEDKQRAKIHGEWVSCWNTTGNTRQEQEISRGGWKLPQKEGRVRQEHDFTNQDRTDDKNPETAEMSCAKTGGMEWEEVCVGTRCMDGKYKRKETQQGAPGRRQTMPRVTTTAICRKCPTYLLFLRRYGGEKLTFADV